MHSLLGPLPLQFRVLYRRFLLRIVDLEALSVQADIVGFLGQFAGILIMLSLIHAFLATVTYLSYPPSHRLAFAWHVEQYLISTMMLVVGLVTVIGWDATFPDGCDVMVLSPLPVNRHTLLFAKVAASASILGLAILTLNAASGIAWPLVLGLGSGSNWGFLQFCLAYWFTMIAASAFLYCSVLTVQGFTALLLSRRIFLRLSAHLQLTAFALFLGVYFLQPILATPAALAAPENQRLVDCSPSFWFFALFNQLGGSPDPTIASLARRAWVGLAAVVTGAASSLLLCYPRTLRKIVEESDLITAARGWHWVPRLGNPLQTAVTLFSLRSLLRSRQHRVVVAFYLGVGFAIALFCVQFHTSQDGSLNPALHPVTTGFLISTFIMMSFAVAGLRSAFSLPISLTANWVLRITEVCPSQKYIAATKRTLFLLAVVPVWIGSAVFSLPLRPSQQAAGHLLILALLGSILVDLNLLGFYKIPFTCSYLPRKSNIQLGFWAFLLLLVPVAIAGARFEQQALNDLFQYVCTAGLLGVVACGLWAFNRHRAKSSVLYFEEIPAEVITTLGII